jgi:signal peptidase II
MGTSTPAANPNRIGPDSVFAFLRKAWRDYVILFLLAAAIIALDQWTKALVRTDIPLGGDWLPGPLTWLLPYARIVHWNNSGAAFGFFQNGGLIFTVLAIVVAGVIIYYYPTVPRRDVLLRLSLGMLLGGSIGNLIDRVAFGNVTHLVFGSVTDFISLGNFAVFNVADSSITVGVGLLILSAWLNDRAMKKSKGQPQAASSGGEGQGE